MKPKPGNAYGCRTGYDPSPRTLRSPKVKLRLKGKEKVGDQLAFAVWAQDPKSEIEETYYFDVKTYVGEQKMDGHQTLVLTFAQKPGSVRLPTDFYLDGKSIPVFFQGVAWVDASDFRIVRLRTDLLAPVPEVALSRLTADIQFAETPGVECGARGTFGVVARDVKQFWRTCAHTTFV